jgi:hypothetical protein
MENRELQLARPVVCFNSQSTHGWGEIVGRARDERGGNRRRARIDGANAK